MRLTICAPSYALTLFSACTTPLAVDEVRGGGPTFGKNVEPIANSLVNVDMIGTQPTQ